jgi:hypothetical protein
MFPALTCAALGLIPLPADPTPARAAATRSLPLLVKGAEGHVEKRSCFACHNQAFPVMAMAAARDRGFTVADESFTTQTEHIARFLTDNREKFLKGEGTGGQADTASYALLTLELAGHKPDETTAAVVEYLLKRDRDRDHWRTTSNRPPSEASSFTTTYLALRALRVWATDEQRERAARRVEAARGWLLKTGAKDTEDRVFRLFGLAEVKADAKDVSAAAWELLKTQRADGGWAQKEGMESDPYATGTALVALHRAGGLPTDHPAYRQGVAFLVKTQRDDGSWLVKSRSNPFQPYYESGFPHGKNQFISVAASGWATTALVLSCEKR